MASVLVSDLGLREGVLIDLGTQLEGHCDDSSGAEQIAKARAAWRLSHELMQDLIAGTQAYWVFQKQLEVRSAREPVPTAIRRLCLTHLVIALSKWTELYRLYRDVISLEVSKDAKNLVKVIESRGVVTFRNKVAGHVWDDETKRALTVREIEERLSMVLGGDVDDFLKWINNPQESNIGTVVGIIEKVHNQIRAEYGFTEEDLLL
jgi:hypothetical protein